MAPLAETLAGFFRLWGGLRAALSRRCEYQRIHLFKQGELTGALLKALREAGKPCSTSELVTAVLAETGASETARCGMTHRIRSSLQYLWRERRTVAKNGKGHGVTWSLT